MNSLNKVNFRPVSHVENGFSMIRMEIRKFMVFILSELALSAMMEAIVLLQEEELALTMEEWANGYMEVERCFKKALGNINQLKIGFEKWEVRQ